MKYFARHLFICLMIVALTGAMAFGKDKVKRARITFPDNLTVNGTAVKAGDYDVKFDEATGELTISKGSKVVAKTMAKLEDRSTEAHGPQIHLRDNALVSITFSGDRHDVVVDSGSSTTGNQ